MLFRSMDKSGKIWNNWAEVEADNKVNPGNNATARLVEGMFTPTGETAKLPLEHCMRVYAHQQDTGGFFITVLEKKSEFKAKPEFEAKTAPKPPIASVIEALESQPADAPVAAKIEVASELLGEQTSTDLAADQVSPVVRSNVASDQADSTLKREREEDVLPEAKKAKVVGETETQEAAAELTQSRTEHVPIDRKSTRLNSSHWE